MAKKNNPYLLFAISTCLLSAAWLMKSFPLLIFTGIAPLFAITDKANPEKSFWNYFELILLALCISLLSAYVFDMKYIVPVLIQGIILTCSFVCYAFASQKLGSWLGNYSIIIFWLAFEYLFLKLSWPNPTLFLADALSLKKEWLKWTQFSGYLGASCWILLSNLVLYYALLKSKKINMILIVTYLLLVVGPIIYSYTLSSTGVQREEMIALYEGVDTKTDSDYIKHGEYIPRTAALISGLILIFALLKVKTEKK